MEYEDFSRPFRFIVTGRLLAILYNGREFELHQDRHGRGTLFHLSDDEEQIIFNRSYIGSLSSHSDFPDDVFYIKRDQQANLGQPPPTIAPLVNRVTSTDNPISADGIDLYQPGQQFILYPFGGLWMGNTERSPEDKLVFRGNPYSDGMTFEFSVHNGNMRITSDDGMFLSVVMPTNTTECRDEKCQQHTASTRCPQCQRRYTMGFVSEPRDCITLIPRGLPSMFVFFDSIYYYHLDALRGSYAELVRVERIEDASLFQFVSFLS
ncbi:uncharacterized protein N7511_004663 [Penicillium nucicola]|uniref:uncharacterized protein n=1 Tax=Penicillium nucicola TaxID=1850975 RepID=UPI0025459384|nr:uncharacterized protein N7511_004663 [Penicillium nucicola]KAJ5767047.1 hypothetical protein N7511_004663 [Penicillium nucicola]